MKHQTVRFAELNLRDRCSTSYDLASLFRKSAILLTDGLEKIVKRTGTSPSVLHPTPILEGKLAELLRF